MKINAIKLINCICPRLTKLFCTNTLIQTSSMWKKLCENVLMSSIIFKSQILDAIISIEKKYNEITIIKNKPIDHMKVSENLLELAEVEENNNNEYLSVFCKFCSKQMRMISTTHHKRIYPENSFTIACAF